MTPYEISYQGVLRDDTGELVPDGTYDIHFILYTVQYGGAPVWADTMSVDVDDDWEFSGDDVGRERCRDLAEPSSVPGPGYIQVVANVRINVSHDYGTYDFLSVGVGSSPSGQVASQSCQMFEVDSGEPSDSHIELSKAVVNLGYAPEAGTYTYNISGKMASGQNSGDYFEQAHLYAIYHPAQAAAVRASMAEADVLESAAPEE